MFRKSHLVGKRVKVTRQIPGVVVQIPVGHLMMVFHEGKYYGIQSPCCPHCGLSARVSAIRTDDFDVLPDPNPDARILSQ